jgi:acetyl-CoA carboxylase biotin carboxylase subunit
VPIVPGTKEPVRDDTEAKAVAAILGYPVLVKAVAGGGGKGMRVVARESDLSGALDAARREAQNAFGDDTVYFEKYIAGPRHVEIQILADQQGTVLSTSSR